MKPAKSEPQSGFSSDLPRSRSLLVDDHASWRSGVHGMLLPTEFEVAGETASGFEAIAGVRAVRPQIVLLDIRLAQSDGSDALKTMKAEFPKWPSWRFRIARGRVRSTTGARFR